MTINWDGLNGYTLGVWAVNIVICTNVIGTPISTLLWNVGSTVHNTATKQSVTVNTSGSYSNNNQIKQLVPLSFILSVTNLTTICYLNFWLGGGSGLFPNLTLSEISFTRIAWRFDVFRIKTPKVGVNKLTSTLGINI